MHDNPQAEQKRAVLQSIGRNVLNLQKMEGMFKSLAVYAEFSGPVEELAELLKERRNEFSRKSLGQLVGEFIDRLKTEEPPELEESDRDIPWIDFRFALVESEQSISELRNSLAVLVDERNTLIHQSLLAFDIESEESRATLLAELDQQHKRIQPAYRYLQERVDALNAAKNDIHADMLRQLSEMS